MADLVRMPTVAAISATAASNAEDEGTGRTAMIKRIWHGYTTLANADAYERLLDTVIFPGIEAKKIPGYRSIELFRRELSDEVQFTTILTFDSIDNVIAFQGPDYEL